MKKMLLFLLMIVCYNNLFAFVSQGHWRWRKDDGSETTATWLGAQDETVTISTIGETIRLRIELYNDDANSNDPKDAILQYAVDGTETWLTITTTAGTNAFVLSGTSPNVTDLQPTTQQITGVGLTFEAGRVMVSSDKIPGLSVSANAETEYEYCIKPTPAIAASTTYKFRVEATNHNAGFTPPKLTTAGVLPVIFTGFGLQKQENKVKINWTTGSEQNNDHFTVERSTNASDWMAIGTVKSTGKSGSNSYSFLDGQPLAGANYYRIVQHDKDGRSSNSGVKNILMELKALFAASVYPNPATNGIRLSVNNYEGNINAILTNAAGTVVYNKKIAVSGALNSYTLALVTKPAPGIYMLRVIAGNMQEQIKVIVP